MPRPGVVWRALWSEPDRSTEQGRAQDRVRRVVLSGGASVLAKLITILASIISVPLTLHYLGAERYGIWMVLTSFTLMLSFADMGLGNGILNAISREHGRDDRAAIRTVVSSGYLLLAGVGLAIIIGFWIAYPFVSWFRLFNVQSAVARGESGPALAVFITCFALAIPLGLVQKVQTGLQQGFISSLWQCLGSVLSLIGVLIAIWMQAGLPWLVLSLVGSPLLMAFLNTVMFFARGNADIRPARSLFSRDVALAAFRTGAMFFVLQIVVSIAYGADNIIVAQKLGGQAVAQYAVPERMFSIITMMLTMLLSPLWPAYGEAIERGDHDWVRKTLRRAVILSATASAVLSGTLVLIGPAIIHLWVGPQVQAPLILLLGLAAWKVVEATSSTLAIYMNGANLLGFQIGAATICAAAMVTLKLVLINQIGAAGIPWGAVLTYLPIVAIPSFIFVFRKLRR